MDHDGARWIGEMPAGLAAQQDLLRGLLAFSQADPDVKWLVMGCSLARGAGDRLRVAELLGEVGGQLGEEQRRALPSAMGRFVIADLRAAISDLRAAME